LIAKFYDSLPAVLKNFKKKSLEKILISKEYYDVADFFKSELRISENVFIMFVTINDI
jgi:hypothetical protein